MSQAEERNPRQQHTEHSPGIDILDTVKIVEQLLARDGGAGVAAGEGEGLRSVYLPEVAIEGILYTS